MKRASVLFTLCVLMVAFLAGCGASTPEKEAAADNEQELPYQRKLDSEHFSLHLIDVLSHEDESTLVKDESWSEYRLEVLNKTDQPLRFNDSRLLDEQGRYWTSASEYEEIIAPPDPGREAAENVAGTAAGVAAGQVIPYGGTLISIFTTVLSAQRKVDLAENKREFFYRKLGGLELAPGGKSMVSAFFPVVATPRMLILDYSVADEVYQIEFPVGSRSTPTSLPRELPMNLDKRARLASSSLPNLVVVPIFPYSFSD